MTKRNYSFLLACILLTAFIFSSCERDNGEMDQDPVVINKPDLVFYGLTASNQLVKLNANNVGTAMATIAITGLPVGEKISSIDFRPATGQLYGLGTNRIYVINHETGAATAIGAGPFVPDISGLQTGFDFNPAVDRIRIVTTGGQNLRVNPETGAVAAVDVPLNPGTPRINGSAYTNSFAGTDVTTLYAIDLSNRRLYRQDPPNAGTLTEVGFLGNGNVSASEAGFDISPTNAVALYTYTYDGSTRIYRVDLSNGSDVDLGVASTPLIGLAIPTLPVAYSINATTNALLIFNLQTPVIPTSKTVTGLQPGESILGIDFRPANGQLYALGSTSRLYTINTSNGLATVVGPQFSTLLNGTNFGFDFNPTVDRIRVVSNTGQNLRLNPITGDIAAVDVALNPGAPGVSAAAYTNNFAGATTTVLYDIDHLNGKLYRQDPPNAGLLVEVGSLGVSVANENGFDIAGTSGKAYAFFNIAATNKIYTINLATGAATEVAAVPASCKGLAIGLGF